MQTFSVMELAGLEPATSWVPFYLERLPGFVAALRSGSAMSDRSIPGL